MEKLPCSLFNDVIGPVMRGPSSSHVAGAARIAGLVRQSFDELVVKAVVDFDINGALAASHTGHGTDMGFACGLMDMDLSNPAVDRYEELARERNIEIEYRILDYGAVHPGNYRMEVYAADGKCHRWEAVSVGGGMIEMQKFDGFDVVICGDFYELLVVVDTSGRTPEQWRDSLGLKLPGYEYCLLSQQGDRCLINWKFAVPLNQEQVKGLKETDGVADAAFLEPILPTHSSANCKVPYSNGTQLLEYAREHQMPAWEYAALYEACRGGISRQEVYDKMDRILTIMEQAVDTGLGGTSYKDRILGPQAYRIAEAEEAGRLVPCGPLNEMIRCITAVMETKSSMGVIVAAPTCGSCGCLPGTVIGLARAMGLPREAQVRALLTAGLIGVFIAELATFSAEVAGCQVECGAGSGMAAAAVAQMLGGNIEECVNAASVALQNITGLACDPVANRVEVPCLGKNVMGGSNAIVSANMVMAGYDKVIPLDETIEAIYEIGQSLPLELRCTFGGLGCTKAARELLKKTESHFADE